MTVKPADTFWITLVAIVVLSAIGARLMKNPVQPQ